MRSLDTNIPQFEMPPVEADPNLYHGVSSIEEWVDMSQELPNTETLAGPIILSQSADKTDLESFPGERVIVNQAEQKAEVQDFPEKLSLKDRLTRGALGAVAMGSVIGAKAAKERLGNFKYLIKESAKAIAEAGVQTGIKVYDGTKKFAVRTSAKYHTGVAAPKDVMDEPKSLIDYESDALKAKKTGDREGYLDALRGLGYRLEEARSKDPESASSKEQQIKRHLAVVGRTTPVSEATPRLTELDKARLARFGAEQKPVAPREIKMTSKEENLVAPQNILKLRLDIEAAAAEALKDTSHLPDGLTEAAKELLIKQQVEERYVQEYLRKKGHANNTPDGKVPKWVIGKFYETFNLPIEELQQRIDGQIKRAA